MYKFKILSSLVLILVIVSGSAISGPVNPDCTAGKAAKSTAAKATVGVGGRCSAKGAVSDTAREVADIDKKGPVKKNAMMTV